MITNPHKGNPSGWIQWKGTDVCIDIHCSCGGHSHYDGEFMYLVKCPYCGKIWEPNGHILLEEPHSDFDLDNVSEAFK